MRTLFLSLAFLFAISICHAVEAPDPDATGTLIVTYQTGVRGERLDRTRFLIKDALHHLQMYPKGKAYVDDDFSLNRMVVIEDLPQGEYTIEFVLPNSDQLFEDVQPRKFTMSKDAVVKIDQALKVRYATVKAMAQPAPDAPAFTAQPTITLHDESAALSPQSSEGKLDASYLLPGSYSIVFQDLPGYQAPPPVHFTISASESAGPFVGVYKAE